MRFRKGWKNRSGFDQESLEKELRHKMILEDQVCLGSVKMIEVAKSETQVAAASTSAKLLVSPQNLDISFSKVKAQIPR